MLDGVQSLVLNADGAPMAMLPLSTWDWKEAVHAVWSDRVTVVINHDLDARSPSFSMPVPSVVMLKEYVQRRRVPSITRMNLLTLRDGNACAYCGKTFPQGLLTFDHVVPRSQGGRGRWENLVSACTFCNQVKRDRTPSEAKMPLLWRPYLPTTEQLARRDFFVNARRIHESWKPFLPYTQDAA